MHNILSVMLFCWGCWHCADVVFVDVTGCWYCCARLAYWHTSLYSCRRDLMLVCVAGPSQVTSTPPHPWLRSTGQSEHTHDKQWKCCMIRKRLLSLESGCKGGNYTVSQKTDPYYFLARLHQKSIDVGNFWRRQLHFIGLCAFASDTFNAIENHLQFPWQWQQTCGLTLNRRMSTKQLTSGENDSGPLWRPKENTFIYMYTMSQKSNSLDFWS